MNAFPHFRKKKNKGSTCVCSGDNEVSGDGGFGLVEDDMRLSDQLRGESGTLNAYFFWRRI